MFRSVPLLLLVFLPAPGPVAPAPTPAGSCCDDPTQLAMARCTGSSSCRACKSCSSCAHCKGGGTCGVCAGEIFGDGQAEEEKAPDLRPLYAEPPAPKKAARPKAAPKPAAKADRAAVLYRIAMNLYRNNQRESSLEYFKQVVKEYPASPQAKDAAAKVKILTGK